MVHTKFLFPCLVKRQEKSSLMNEKNSSQQQTGILKNVSYQLAMQRIDLTFGR